MTGVSSISSTAAKDVRRLLSQETVILASKSPRREQICREQLAIKHLRIVGSQFPENLDKDAYAPFEYVVETAVCKALDIYKSEVDSDEPPELVLAADTVIEHNGVALEKPRGVDHHVAMLKKLRDAKHPHKVFTGVVAIVPFEKPIVPGYAMETYLGESTVEFRHDLTDEEILNYVASGEGSDAAGGYKIQEKLGRSLIKEYTGDINNIVGLPVEGTIALIAKAMAAAAESYSESGEEFDG